MPENPTDETASDLTDAPTMAKATGRKHVYNAVKPAVSALLDEKKSAPSAPKRAAMHGPEPAPIAPSDPQLEAGGITVSTSPPRRSKPAPFRAGAFLDGRYRLIRPLGAGGMAAVFLADDVLLRRKVALKQLDSGGPDAAAELELFRKEAAVTHAITHPNIARTYDIGEAGNSHYISMEWLDGETLMQRIRREPLSATELRELVIPLCRGLQAAHRAGIVHRDLKPANVMLVSDERKIVVMDFGIAGRAGSVPEGDAPSDQDSFSPWGITSAGRGTPAYMAPEQWRQESGDERTDIYALGVIMYVALTCKSPFEAKSIAELEEHHKSTEPPDVTVSAPDVDRGLARLIRRCLAKDPADRPSSMDDILDALHSRKRRNRWLGGAAIATTLAATATLLVHFGIFSLAKSAVLHEVRPGVERLARLTAEALDPAVLNDFHTPADMKLPAFKQVVATLQPFAKDTPDIKAVYVLRKKEKPGMFEFVADNEPEARDRNGDGKITAEEEGSPPGLEYDGTEYPAMRATLETNKSHSDPAFSRDQWGMALSGYAPIRDSEGQASNMIVGVDAGNAQLDALRNHLDVVLALAFGLFALVYAAGTYPTRGGGTVWRDTVKRWTERSASVDG